jgi:glycosyltransferase involved in cell wall biosynthesis
MTAEKPSVYTIHDAWLLSGHCVHSMGCDKWRYGCGTCANLDVDFPMQKDNAAFMWEMKKSTLEKANIDIVVASDYMMELVRQSPITNNIKHIHKIPFGVDTELFSPAADKEALHQKLKIQKGNFVISFRMDSQYTFKGISCIIEALRRLDPSKPVTLLTVGSKGGLNQFKSRYQVIDYEWVTESNLMADIYKASDLFLMPSTAEAFGMMAIEAMACGIPVLVCDGTALPNVTFAPECGINIPQNDSEMMCRVIERMICSPCECETRGTLGRKLALENYRFEDYIERHLELYEEVHTRRYSKENDTKQVNIRFDTYDKIAHKIQIMPDPDLEHLHLMVLDRKIKSLGVIRNKNKKTYKKAN